jgi:hypothetical protein
VDRGPWELCPTTSFFLHFLIQSALPKSGPGNRGKVLMLRPDSEHDAKPVVHHLDDAGNYFKICNFFPISNIA